MFGANAQWLWENFDHYAIEQICKEKLNIDEFLDDESNSESFSPDSSVQKKLDKLNQEFLIYNDKWKTLKDLHNLEKKDYTEKELEEIIDRGKRREDTRRNSLEKNKEKIENEKKENKEKLDNAKSTIMKGGNYMNENDLENLILNASDSFNYLETDTIEEDRELLKDTKRK